MPACVPCVLRAIELWEPDGVRERVQLISMRRWGRRKVVLRRIGRCLNRFLSIFTSSTLYPGKKFLWEGFFFGSGWQCVCVGGVGGWGELAVIKEDASFEGESEVFFNLSDVWHHNKHPKVLKMHTTRKFIWHKIRRTRLLTSDSKILRRVEFEVRSSLPPQSGELLWKATLATGKSPSEARMSPFWGFGYGVFEYFVRKLATIFVRVLELFQLSDCFGKNTSFQCRSPKMIPDSNYAQTIASQSRNLWFYWYCTIFKSL